MEFYEIPTDEALRYAMPSGNTGFPFECYIDEIGKFRSRCIEWHWHNAVEFSFVLNGTVRCRTDSVEYTLERGDGLFVNSETLHRYESDDGGIMADMLLTPEFIAPQDSLIYANSIENILLSDRRLIPFRKTAPADDIVLSKIFNLYETVCKSSFSRELKIRNAASILWDSLADFTRGSLTQSQNRGDKLLRARMQRMIHFIHTNYALHIGLKDIAASANISVSEALRCFRTAIQTTPINYLNDHRFTRAKDLLLGFRNRL